MSIITLTVFSERRISWKHVDTNLASNTFKEGYQTLFFDGQRMLEATVTRGSPRKYTEYLRGGQEYEVFFLVKVHKGVAYLSTMAKMELEDNPIGLAELQKLVAQLEKKLGIKAKDTYLEVKEVRKDSDDWAVKGEAVPPVYAKPFSYPVRPRTRKEK